MVLSKPSPSMNGDCEDMLHVLLFFQSGPPEDHQTDAPGAGVTVSVKRSGSPRRFVGGCACVILQVCQTPSTSNNSMGQDEIVLLERTNLLPSLHHHAYVSSWQWLFEDLHHIRFQPLSWSSSFPSSYPTHPHRLRLLQPQVEAYRSLG
jgi:hypothetical protein